MDIPEIGLAGWSFHRLFESGRWTFADCFGYAAVHGVRSVELNNVFFASMDSDYLTDLRESAAGVGVSLVNLTVDDHGHSLSDPHAAARGVALNRALGWLGVAQAMGIPSVRFNTGDGSESLCAESFAALAREAARNGMRVLIENHGGLSSDSNVVCRVLDAVGREFPGVAGVLWDTGNPLGGSEGEQFVGKAALVHLKEKETPLGEEELRRIFAVLSRADYRGRCLVEYEGDGDGIRETERILATVNRLKNL